MHWIQYHTLDLLINSASCRFSELRPENVDSNLFQWHLKHLIKQGYVTKLPNREGYELAPRGLHFADRLSRKLKTERRQAKIVTIIVLRNSKGQLLLHVDNRQPFIGTARFPAGKVHEGESLEAAARREAREKVEIEIENLIPGGAVHMRIYVSNELVSEYFGFIFLGDYDDALPKAGVWVDSAGGVFGTDDPGDVKLMTGVEEIIRYVLDGKKEMQEIEIFNND